MKTIFTALVLITAAATGAIAEPNPQVMDFIACAEAQGFQEGPDFRIRPLTRVVAGVEVEEGGKIQVANAILRAPPLREKINFCLRQAGMPVPGD